MQPVTANNRHLRSSLYRGTIYHASPTLASFSLIHQVRQQLEKSIPNPEQAHHHLPSTEILQKITELRQILASAFRKEIMDVMATIGFESTDLFYDALRLRAIVPNAHLIPAASPAYFAHRDTWYANPQSQINVWIPLANYPAEQTFVFFPDAFQTPIANDSEHFDYLDWKKNVGWQNPNPPTQAIYPSAQGDLPPGRPFACQAGDMVLFSAAHLHQTCPNVLNTIRYSLDFRVVHRGDHKMGQGAPNVDNRSKGSTLEDFWRSGTSQNS